MTAYKLHRVEAVGRAVRLNKTEASTLMGFQRSAYARPLKEILLKVLDDSRIQNESEEANETNRLRVVAVKEVLDTLFTGRVELER